MNKYIFANCSFRRMLLRILSIIVILAMAFPVTGDVSAQELVLWRDEFDGPLASDWYWVHGNQNKWNLTEREGFLRIYASSYGTGGENLLLRSVAPGDFMIKTRVIFEPDTNFQFAGLVIWQDENNFLQLGRAFCYYEDAPCVGNGIYFDHVGGGTSVAGNFATSIGNPSDVFLRLERRGDMVRAFYSADEGISWYEIGTHWIPPDFQVNGVGLTASQDFNTPDSDIPADFDFFELTEGWGFLPEGYHDGEQGDVPSWACNANGWATDPDDPAADVNVEIVVDHQTVATLPAGDFRQDLADANVCVDGNCSFSAGLWDLMTSYEPHRVDAWAQDDTGAWVLLNNSAKTLTCRTYDIYAYDPLTGTTRQITNLRDKDEYDPTWSPNGKKVAHDVVTGDGHGIYITDLRTGVSTPLIGAEDGGNDASWSPNGKWIAFDRRWYGEPHIFIVPATGGERTLVRENAVNANWAPNGKRIVFQDDTDGSIRTVPVDGGTGVENLIVDYGSLPAWSPDGNWIAYSKDGDIWKVRVNVQGRVIGQPIQLTSNPFNDGKSTWSPDSQTIIYDSGFGQDYDLWSIPAAGGMPTWLTGAPVFGEYGPANARNSSTIAFAGFSPEVQAARSWVSAYTYDAGTWSPGGHNYHFEATWNGGSETTDEISFTVLDGARHYPRYALLRPGAVRVRSDCMAVDTISSEQSARFLSGYVTDNPMLYSDAQAYFDSLSASAVWDDGQSAELERHEIIPFNEGDWFNYVCTFTEAPPKMDLRVHYGDNWVESFYEAGHNVHLTVTESDGVTVKATADVVTEAKDYWGGGTGFQTNDSPWYDAAGNPIDGQPDIRPYDWVFASVDNGATAQVQIGEIRGVLDVTTDSVQGTALVPWFSNELNLECWGGPVNPKSDAVLPDGADPYVCSWAGEWDILYTDAVGVAYFGPDGHWVANVFRNPHVHIYPEQDFIEADEWAEGLQVNAWVEGKDECTTEGVPTYPPGNPWTTNVYMPFPDACELVAGDVVYASNGITIVSHTIRNLAITDVNKVENTVTGTADNGELVFAWVHGYGETEEQLLVTDGSWVSHFNGFDLIEGMCGRSEIRDEVGNTTGVDWCIPNPRFSAFPEWEYIEGWDWQLDTTVYLSIDDPATETNPDFVQDQPVVVTPWDPNAVWVTFSFAGQYNMKVGDTVTLTDGDVTRTHTIRNLTITNADSDTNSISGTADAGAEVHVWPHGFNELIRIAGQDGSWLADFNTIGIDLSKGMSGRTEVRDEFGNATAVDWRILNPFIEAAPYSDWIHAREWPIGTVMTLEIDDPANGPGVDYSDTATMQQAPWNPNDPNDIVADFRWPDQFAPGPGYVLTMSGDDGQSKTLTISDLKMTSFDLVLDTISGTGTPNAQIQVCANLPNRCITRWVTADGESNWTANYGVPGTGNDDPDTVDIQPGSNGWAADYEADSDRTWFDWWIPNPRMTVFPEWEWFDGMDWPDGATVNISVASKPQCTTSKVSSGNFFNGSFGENCDLAIGDEVTFSDGTTIRTHTVQNLRVLAVDEEANTVEGTVEPGTPVHVWPHGYNELVQIADGSGYWLADFDDLTIDLGPGMSGRSEVRDDVGNATAVDWYIPNPRIVASITEDWFYVNDFAPNTELAFAVYASEGGTLISEATTPPTDGSGHVWVEPEGRWDLQPGNYVTVSDGTSAKDLVIEGFTFDIFNMTNGHLEGTAPGPAGRRVWAGIGWQDGGWSADVFTDAEGTWKADYGNPVPTDYWWVAAQIFDADGDASELRPASQTIFLRPACGNTYTVQPNIPLEIRYGSWVAIGEELANQNAEHLTVELVLNGETLTGEKQSVVPRSEIPCGTPREDAYSVFYAVEVDPLSSGTYIAEVTWILDEAVTDGFDADGDGEPEWYGPGMVDTREFMIIVP